MLILGAANQNLVMFIRKNKNRSGSVSIQIIRKDLRRNKVIMTVGCAKTKQEEEFLVIKAQEELERMQGMQSLFVEHDDIVVEHFVDSLESSNIQIIGTELILGRIYDKIGFPDDGCCNYFKNLVLSRLVYPGSKLKTVDYFKRHLNMDVSVYSIYRFLDELHSNQKQKIEKISFEHTKKILSGKIGVVFYDMTTLYFEASDEDDFRIQGYSKDGKHQQPQIMIGLLVSSFGYPIGYQVFEGNKSETKTLIPVLEAFQKAFEIAKPIIIADAALLSQKNINALQEQEYEYILGGRIKNENQAIKNQISQLNLVENEPQELLTANGRLIVTYSAKRARNDKKNREKGLKRLEKKVISGKLRKEHINNRGYNKYLKLTGEAKVSIDYQEFEKDAVWDGLKGYVTNTKLHKNEVISNYNQLWQVEKAFRISKTDLRIRPIYHRLRKRIEAHICICFTAYTIYKELERLLQANRICISPEKAITEIKEIKQLTYVLPKSKSTKTKLLKPSQLQTQLISMKI